MTSQLRLSSSIAGSWVDQLDSHDFSPEPKPTFRTSNSKSIVTAYDLQQQDQRSELRTERKTDFQHIAWLMTFQAYATKKLDRLVDRLMKPRPTLGL